MKQGWEYKKLGEICNITMGQSPDGKSINTNEGVEFHQGKTCFGERTLGVSSLFSNAPVKLAEAHSVLLCVRAPVGYPNITNRKICIGRGLCALYAKEDIDNTFLFYSLLGKQSHFEKNATGSTFKAISSKVISNTEIPLPPKSTQLSIVSELDKINELIRLKKEQLKDYDNLAQSIFYEMFGDPVENEKGWEVKKLSSLFKVSSSKRIMQEEWAKEGVPFLKVSDIVSLIKYGKVSPSTFISKLKFKKLEEAKMVPTVGDILITSRGTLGLCYIIKTDDKFYFQDGMVTWLSENTGDIIPIYITYVFSNNHFLEILAGRANKSTVSYISIKQISQKEITVPPLPLQHLFAQRIEQIERQKSAVQKSITDLETLLASRMQYWFE